MLISKLTSFSSTAAGADSPVRNQFEPPIQAIQQMSMAVDQDFKATTGIYEPTLGRRAAIRAGKQSSGCKGNRR